MKFNILMGIKDIVQNLVKLKTLTARKLYHFFNIIYLIKLVIIYCIYKRDHHLGEKN